MEGKLTKRRRIYSVEPNKIAQAEFTRIYLSHLVPALMKLNQNQKMKKMSSTVHISEEEEDDEKKNKNNICLNVVKHEVRMAMVWSAPPGFAWSKALKANVGKINDHHHNKAPYPSPYNFSANPTTTTGSSSKSCVHNKEEDEQDDKEEEEEDEEEEEEEDDEEGFKRLRRLIPGGEEIADDEEMARELESYISCLKMQVSILQRLAHTTP